MKFLAQLELNDGSIICLPLNCRDYHANKLQYVLSRTLDRSVFRDAHVCAVSDSCVPTGVNIVVPSSKCIGIEDRSPSKKDFDLENHFACGL